MHYGLIEQVYQRQMLLFILLAGPLSRFGYWCNNLYSYYCINGSYGRVVCWSAPSSIFSSASYHNMPGKEIFYQEMDTGRNGLVYFWRAVVLSDHQKTLNECILQPTLWSLKTDQFNRFQTISWQKLLTKREIIIFAFHISIKSYISLEFSF